MDVLKSGKLILFNNNFVQLIAALNELQDAFCKFITKDIFVNHFEHTKIILVNYFTQKYTEAY